MRTSFVTFTCSLALAAVIQSPQLLAQNTAPKEAPAKDAVRNVAIVLYPSVELLDFAGPGEVLSSVHGAHGPAFHVYTVAKSRDPIHSQGFVEVKPEFTFADCPRPDLVVLPGGGNNFEDAELLAWLKTESQQAELMMSVCNGAVGFAKAGLLKGLEATTHHSALQEVALIEPSAKVYENRRFVDNGHVITAAGISAGIDGALHVVQRLCGDESAWQTAHYMEYDWRPDEIERLHKEPGRSVGDTDALRWCNSIASRGFEGALADYKKLENAPNETKLNGWGYTLLRAKRVDDSIALFHLESLAFPDSVNALDSWAEALEVKGDSTTSIATTKLALEKLEKDTKLKDINRAMLHNAGSSRIARLSGAPASSFRYMCEPCSGPCDKLYYVESSRCPNCGMQLVERTP